MKTAMQELISQMHDLTWKLMTYEQKIEVFNIFLEKEKEQIIEAANYGLEHFGDIAEKYYNQTYNKN